MATTFFVSQEITSNDGNDGLSVGAAFLTIGAALAAAVDGDTIIVGDGTYNENILIANDGITLISENGRGETTIVGSNVPPLHGTVQIAPGLNNVTIGEPGKGFTIVGFDGPPGQEKGAIYLDGAADGLIIQGNDVVANGDAGLMSKFGFAITNALIDSNIFSGQTFLGDNPAGDGFGSQFTLLDVPRQLVLIGNNNGPSNNITFTNNQITGTAGGLNENGDPQGNTLVTIDAANSTISGNDFTGFTNRFATQLRARDGDTDITNNTFSNDEGGHLGVYVEDDGVPGSYAGNTFVSSSGNAIFGTPGNDAINGTDGDDTIADVVGNNTINGGDGDDTILAGPGNDNVNGGEGNDTYDMTAAGASGAFVDLQSNLAFSTNTGIDNLTSIENVRGSAGADGLYGDGNANTFFATAGADVIDGRGGSDTFDASNAATTVNINLSAGTVTGAFTASLTSIENAVGGSVSDTFYGSDAANTLIGNGGNDQFYNLGDGDVVDGGSGLDTAFFAANFSDAIITAGDDAGTYTVTIGGATTTLTGVGVLNFNGQIARVVSADPDASDYATIQDAVDAANPDDIVYILNGNYDEQVEIAGMSNLTIRGESEAGVVINPVAGPLEQNGVDANNGRLQHAIFAVSDSTNITFQNLTIDGEARGDSVVPGNDFVGLASANSSVTVEDVTITGIRDTNPLSGTQRGNAIVVSNNDAPTNTFSITGSTIEDFQKTGIVVRNTDVTIDGNEIDNGGAHPVIARNGIQLSHGAFGEVTNNQISGVGYTGPENVVVVGVLVFDSIGGLNVSGNTFTGTGEDDVFTYLINSDNATVEGNTIEDADYGVLDSGNIDGSNAATTNTFTDVGVNYGFYPNDGIVSDFDVTGTAGNDELFGAAGNDTLNGLAGDDYLGGEGGNDTLIGGEGDDTLDGGAGHDTADYSGTAYAGATFGWNEDDDMFVVTTAAGGTDQVTNVEIAAFTDKTVWLVTDAAGLTAALANAGEGDVIKLAPGEYEGNFTIGIEGLTIESVTGNAEDVVFTGTFRADNNIPDGVTVAEWLETALSTINNAGNGFVIAADNVTIRGLTLSGYDVAIALGSNNGLTLDSVDIDNSITGIRKGTAAVVTNFTMTGGTISDSYQAIAIYAATNAGSFDNVLIDGTIFERLTEKGIYAEQLSNAQLLNLVMTDVGQFGRGPSFNPGFPANWGEFGGGIDINLKHGTYEGITISGFTFTDVGSSLGDDAIPGNFGAAITVKARDDGGTYGPNPAALDGVVISNGTIDGTSTGIRIGEPNQNNAGPENVTVQNVAIENALVGHYDNRTAAVLEVELTGDDDVATTNPSATGPIHFEGGAGDDTITGGGGTDRSLYTASIDAKAGITFDAGTETWSVSAGAEGTDTLKDIEIVDGAESGRILLVGGDGFATLQDAVNAAEDGDTILLASGQFVGDVTIANKALTILGVNNDGIDGNGTRGAESSIVGRVTVTGSEDVTFDGVEFRATATTGTTGPSNGALNLKGSGTYLVQNSVFFNETVGGNNESRGIYLATDFSGAATIGGNLFTGASPFNFSTASWQRGIWSDGTAADLDISGNTFRYVRSAVNLDGYDDATHEVSGNIFEEAGSGISVATPKTATYTGIHDNDFQLVSGAVGEATSGETAFNFQNVTTPVEIDLTASNNASSTGDTVLVLGGTAGDDIVGSAGNDIIRGNGGDDELDGGAGNDILIGGANNDTLIGGDGDDTLYGGAGDDVIIDENGDNVVEGGDGTDTYVLSGDFADYTITYDDVTETHSITHAGGTTTVRGVENFQFGSTVVDVTGNPDVIVTDMTPVVTAVIEQGIDEDASPSTIEVSENATVGTLVARINGTDGNLNAGDSLTYTLVDDLDQPYVGPFTLTQADNGTAFLFLTGSLDFETAPSHDLRVKITDSTGNSVTEDFTIDVLDVNEAPTAIQLSSQTVAENDEGANVAIVTVDDQDNNVTLIEVSDARFEIVNVLGSFVLRLKAGESLDHETEPQIDLTVTATDAGGLSKAQDFTIAVQNANEGPGEGAGGLQQEVELEQGSTRFPLGLTQIVDPEDDTLTYTVSVLPAQGTVFNGNTILIVGAVLTAAQLEALTYTASNTSDADQALEFIVSDGTLSDTLQVNIEVTPAESKTYTGTAGGDRLDGAAGDDIILGLAGNDVLIGGVGNDLLDGGSDADEMHGGAGNDTYEVDNIGDQVFEDEDNGYDTVNSSISYTLGQHVEKLALTGADNINGTGNGLSNHIVGNSGNNIINGGIGADLMEGGAGDDTYEVDNAGDQVSEAKNQGFDTVNSSVSFNLNGQWIEKLVLTGSANINGKGNSLDNVLIGNSGNNVLNGDTGADLMEGGAGNDLYRVDNVGDVAVEAKNNGYDTVSSSVTYNLGGQHVEELVLIGSDNLKAKGNSLDNVIIGNSGNNRIDGERGNDTLTGGAGKDTFIFKSALNAGTNVDTITDFSVVDDTIELHQSAFTALSTGTLSAGAFHIGAAAADASDRIIYNSATGGLLYDSDGAGGNAAVQFATIGLGLALTQNDFVIV